MSSEGPAAPPPTTVVTEEDTRFLQRRVALFGLVGFILAMMAWLISVVQALVEGKSEYILEQSIHLFGACIPLLGWILCRGEKVRSRRFISIVEITVTLCCAICFYVMLTRSQWQTAVIARPDLLAALIMTQIIVTRAIFVPSTALRTALLSTATAAPLFVVGIFVYQHDHAPGGSGRLTFAEIIAGAANWSILGVALATATSSVIYGLRKQVRQAMELGQYTLMQKLGEGGMGQVFRARHAMLRRPTAVKLLHTSSPEDLARFEREVQLTAQLTHPNTVTVFDYGRTPDGVFYYAMELLDGSDLQKLIDAHGPMPPARVIHILSQVAAALAEAHAVGLIHRDIKPANIILCTRGTSFDVAKVVDFGLVKRIEGAPKVDAQHAHAHHDDDEEPMSKRNQVVGTPLYMAPESMTDPARGDIRTDLYSLGAVGYFLLTGTPVFLETTLTAVLSAHLSNTPERPSDRLGKPVDADLETILLDCLAKSPKERPRDALMLRDRLRACKDANGWSDEDARGWWAASEATSEKKKENEVSWTAKTIAVDLVQRSPQATTMPTTMP